MINMEINGTEYQFENEMTILEAARQHDIKIPTLCYNEYLEPYGGCRICLVELVGKAQLIPACASKIAEGMKIETDSERVWKSRKFVLELLLARTPDSEEIKALADEFGIPHREESRLDPVGQYLLYRAPKREFTNCVLCNLCVRVCQEIPQRSALSVVGRGVGRKVQPPFGKAADACIGCQSCAYVCPTNTVTVREVG
ncbi:MAG TPA: 2Fe-2S iron-sulfur cluster binding domain-containing protein [Sediminispirochaeta sp.]|nr:2Fe-2S iron-sulfur cluster binding domain-containing protein [Sediminispirochaeta sp.]